ncbi:MAG: nitroreductase family protein [Syntrophorhabdaceae bacterium]|nr:nitroreductase family protein [Syntrophorhabdaceae bacterium]MDD4195601.1 nitroreductase family protein [Syntrophorhabdaceae bacterium]HOC45923.1 nitroreductase family protein [Syntrophorhabdaceae bacterium]
MTASIRINGDICRKDGLCVRICPKVFTQDREGTVPDISRPEFCNECGHCLLVCPANAIAHDSIHPDRVRQTGKDTLPSFAQVDAMIKARRSIRNFADRPVEKDLIEKVIDAARFAPSAKNTQSTYFTAITGSRTLKQIASMAAGWLGRSAAKLRNPVIREIYLLRGITTREELKRWAGQYEWTGRNMENGIDTILYNAPVLILFHADKHIRFAEANANLALHNGTLAACSLGLGSFYTGYVVAACRHSREIPDLLHIPRRHAVYAGMTLGHIGIGFSRWIERNPARVDWIE